MSSITSLNVTKFPPNIDENEPQNSSRSTKFVPLTLKYTANENLNISKSSKTSKTSRASKSSKSSRRKTHIGSNSSTPRNNKSNITDSWLATPDTVITGIEEHACQFCGKIFTDFRKVIKHIDTCEGV